MQRSEKMEAVRIDKWLWAIRIFKTRSQASEACRSGRIRIADIQVKASREIREGDIVHIRVGPLTRIIKATGLIENRVSGKLAVEFYEDLTPAEEIEKIRLLKEVNYEKREKGTGRPTKKERRLIDRLKKSKF